MAVVLNPAKRGAADARRAIAAAVHRDRDELVVFETTVAEPGATQARRAVTDGCDTVVVAGGDGTVREVALGLCGTGTPMGVVPVGTANLFARNLGLPRRPRRAVPIALAGPPRRIDCGMARLHSHDGWGRDRAFLVLAGVGNDAATVLGTRDHLKDRIGWLAYAESAVRHVRRRPVAMTVRSDDGAHLPVDAWSVLVGNCGRVPGVALFPRARLDDGHLDTMVVTAERPGQWLAAGAKGVLRLPGDVPGIAVGRARRVEVIPGRPVPVQLDGDVFDNMTGARFWLAAGGLCVRVPRSFQQHG